MRVHTKISHTTIVVCYWFSLLFPQNWSEFLLMLITSIQIIWEGLTPLHTIWLEESSGGAPDVRCLGGLRRFGFAGGLGPSTVLPQLEAMHRDCEASYKDAVVWIDMESRIRSQARDPQKPGKNVEILEGKSDRFCFSDFRRKWVGAVRKLSKGNELWSLNFWTRSCTS